MAQAFRAAQKGLKFKGVLSHRKSLGQPRQKPCPRPKPKNSRSYFTPPKRLSIQLFECLQITIPVFPFLLPVFYSSAGDWRLKGEALEMRGWEREEDENWPKVWELPAQGWNLNCWKPRCPPPLRRTTGVSAKSPGACFLSSVSEDTPSS